MRSFQKEQTGTVFIFLSGGAGGTEPSADGTGGFPVERRPEARGHSSALSLKHCVGQAGGWSLAGSHFKRGAGLALLWFLKHLCGPPLSQASLAHVLYTPRAPPRKTWVRPTAVSLPGPSLWPHLRQDGAHWTVLGDQFSPEVWACSREPNLTIPRVYHHLCPEILPGGQGSTSAHCTVGRFL